MPIVKRTFSIPDEISAKLDELIPNQERSKFVAKILEEALKGQAKERLLKMLRDIDPVKPVGKSSEEIIRDIRTRHEEKFNSSKSSDE